MSGYRVVEGWLDWDVGFWDSGFLIEFFFGCVCVVGESGLEVYWLD